MIANKHMTKIIAVLMAIAVGLCLCAVAFSDCLADSLGGTSVAMEYETKLFDTSEIMQVNIIMEDSQWTNMLSNATAEQYYQCDVEINGKTFYNVGIRPKGNTSLSSIASDPDNDRYSLKLEFDQFVDGQTCYGLDKLILNNNFADATNMKEALIYDMYQYIGADASLYNYAKISVNGEYWGVYLALEAVEDSFLLRNYGTENGELYKPDSMDIGNMGAGKMDFSDMDFSNFNFGDKKSTESSSSTEEKSSRKNPSSDKMGGFGSMMGGGGANLNYSDDDLDSYSTIWDCEVTDTSKSDHRRVVTALKNIAEGNSLETYMDVDNLLKYAAVHVFSVNTDSLSGSMAHNYYLYESDGKLNLLPWDYNLSLGGMGGSSDATSTINDAIDNAFSGTNFFDTLLADEEYQQKYYEYMQVLVDEYLLGEGFTNFYNRTLSQIDELVKNDPNALYTYEEYKAALEVLCEVVSLRGQSIEGQLSGTIPSTSTAQKDSTALIDASHIDLSVMGTMSMGGGIGENTADSQEENDMSQEKPEEVPEGFDPSQMGGQMPEDFDPSQFGGQMPEGFDPSQIEQEAQDSTQSGETSTTQTRPSMNFGNSNFQNTMSGLVLYGVCFLVLIGGLLFAALFKRKKNIR